MTPVRKLLKDSLVSGGTLRIDPWDDVVCFSDIETNTLNDSRQTLAKVQIKLRGQAWIPVDNEEAFSKVTEQLIRKIEYALYGETTALIHQAILAIHQSNKETALTILEKIESNLED